MKKMLFETSLTGHIMEYIHHIYMGMLEHNEDEFVIVIPSDFNHKKSLYDWPFAENVRFVFLEEDISDLENGGLINQSFKKTRVLKKYIELENAESVFLISLISYIAALPFLISSKIEVNGIIYRIYLYEWNSSSWKKRIQDVFKFVLMRFTPCLKTIFILNDKKSASRFNQLYHTTKFTYLTDPYNALDYQAHNIRQELSVGVFDKVFLHFGGLDSRKGTLDILNAIPLLPQDQLNRCVFVFAGKVYNSIKQEFYQLKDSLPNESRVIVFDRFCTNEFLADLCVSTDFILAPYHETNCSSGVLGHAAHYGIPVIGPSDGLIGEIIKEYALGITLTNISPDCIAKTIVHAVPYKLETDYNVIIQPESFIKTILN